MSNFVQDWLPTLIGATVFLIAAVGIIAVFSAIASKIEDKFAKGEMSAEAEAEPGAIARAA